MEKLKGKPSFEELVARSVGFFESTYVAKFGKASKFGAGYVHTGKLAWTRILACELGLLFF